MSAPEKICPLLSAGPDELVDSTCLTDRCAWFHLVYHADGDFTEGACALVRIADNLGKGNPAAQAPPAGPPGE